MQLTYLLFSTIFCSYLGAQRVGSKPSVKPLQIEGNRFILPQEDGTKEVFLFKGIDYQPGGASNYNPGSGFDVLSDEMNCRRDIMVLKNLGINMVRIYIINPNLNHDACVSLFHDAGIYLILDINSPLMGESINRHQPWESYNENYMKRVFQVVEAFSSYPNIAGFFVGNEVINDPESSKYSPTFMRAVQRDIRQYVKRHEKREVPLGYSATDDLCSRSAVFDYLRCDIDEDDISKSDFYGLNVYEWCNGNNWDTSGFQVLHDTYQQTDIPIIFSEFGCNVQRPRDFKDVSEGIFAGMLDVFSGGLMFEYSEETNGYGIAQINNSDHSIQLLPDFDMLRAQYGIIEHDNYGSETLLTIQSRRHTKCDQDSLVLKYGIDYSHFDIPQQPLEVARLIEQGVSVPYPGKIIKMRRKKSPYKVLMSDGSPFHY